MKMMVELGICQPTVPSRPPPNGLLSLPSALLHSSALARQQSTAGQSIQKSTMAGRRMSSLLPKAVAAVAIKALYLEHEQEVEDSQVTSLPGGGGGAHRQHHRWMRTSRAQCDIHAAPSSSTNASLPFQRMSQRRFDKLSLYNASIGTLSNINSSYKGGNRASDMKEKYNIDWYTILGEGAYGKVHPARVKSTGEKVCLDCLMHLCADMQLIVDASPRD